MIGEKKKSLRYTILGGISERQHNRFIYLYSFLHYNRFEKNSKKNGANTMKYRRITVLFIIFVIGAAVSPLVKLLIIAPCIVNLFMQYDEYDYKLSFGGAKAWVKLAIAFLLVENGGKQFSITAKLWGEDTTDGEITLPKELIESLPENTRRVFLIKKNDWILCIGYQVLSSLGQFSC